MAEAVDISTFRRRIGDRVKSGVDVITADHTDTVFNLRYNNIFGLVVKINGIQKTPGFDYTVVPESGQVTLATAPADGASIEFDYNYAAYSDAEAGSYIDQFGLSGAVIEALRELLADSARLTDYQQGPTVEKRSQVFAQLEKLLTRYERDGVFGEQNGGGVSIGMRTNEFAEGCDQVGQYDLSRGNPEDFLI